MVRRISIRNYKSSGSYIWNLNQKCPLRVDTLKVHYLEGAFYYSKETAYFNTTSPSSTASDSSTFTKTEANTNESPNAIKMPSTANTKYSPM